MKPMDVEITEEGITQQSPSVFPLLFARYYQLEALETAMKQNTIVFLETGSGKTLIAVMLLQSYARLLKKSSPFFAVFLVPTVPLVQQQSEVLMKHTDLKVGKYSGGKGINFQHPASWSKEIDENEVLVMTPAILLTAMRHSCLKIEMIKVLIFDECHHARGKHPYACIMMEFYHQKMNSQNSNLPRILGMTASPIKAKECSSKSDKWQEIRELENLMHSKIYTCTSESVLAECIPKFYEHRDIPQDVFKALENELKLRLEFLGDAVLDHVVTKCLYYDNPGLTPGLLTDLRSVSVNNDWYAQSAVKARLHEHILLNSQELQRQIDMSVRDFENSSCFGWESEIIFPKILADIVESIAGAIFVDSGYNKETVFQSMRPLFLEPMVTPETIKLHPVRELNELCQKQHFVKKETIGKTFTLEIIANGGTIHKHSRSASNIDMAERLVSKDALKWLKENMYNTT